MSSPPPTEPDEAVSDWVDGLPTADELTPLSQPLLTPELASAFSVTPEPNRTILDVHRASQETITSLRKSQSLPPFSPSSSSAALKRFPSSDLAAVDEERDPDPDPDPDPDEENPNTKDPDPDPDESGAAKRPRLVWTPQLHKRFVDVVGHLGVKNAVPKTIMQMMNVEGLTRENVASHLQKYRLYLKRMQGFSDEGPSGSENLFASTPSPQKPREVQLPVFYGVPPGVVPMPVFGVPPQGNGAHVGMMSGNAWRPPEEWPGGRKFGPVTSFPHVAPGDRQPQSRT